jgi:hypothetical protein
MDKSTYEARWLLVPTAGLWITVIFIGFVLS